MGSTPTARIKFMVLKSQAKLVVGTLYKDRDITDSQGNIHRCKPFFVLEEITKDEYLKSAWTVGLVLKNDYFYRVSID